MQVQGRALFAGSGLFEVAAAASGMLVSCDGLPPGAAKALLLTDVSILAPCVLAAEAAPQLLVCSIDTRCLSSSGNFNFLCTFYDFVSNAPLRFHQNSCKNIDFGSSVRHCLLGCHESAQRTTSVASLSQVKWQSRCYSVQGWQSERPQRQQHPPGG